MLLTSINSVIVCVFITCFNVYVIKLWSCSNILLFFVFLLFAYTLYNYYFGFNVILFWY